MELLGAVLVSGGGLWLGLRAAEELRGRARAAGSLCAALLLMEGELRLSLTPLPVLLERLAGRCPFPADRLMAHCARELGRGERGISQVWPEALNALPGLDWESRTILQPLGSVLGRYDAESQLQALEAARTALEGRRDRLEAQFRSMGRTYRALGLTGGLFLMILLL